MDRRALTWLFGIVVVAALAVDLAHRPERIGIDFHTYLAAALVGLNHGWSHLYDQGTVALMQKRLVPGQWAQPFLSTPPDAWLVTPFAWFPYWTAYAAWWAVTLGALFAAFAWAGLERGVERWIIAGAAIAPWWVLHSVNVGQVVPVVAAAVVVAWRLLRDRHDIASGLVLALVVLKPNTVLLVPVALVFAGRMRAFGAWLCAIAAIAAIAAVTLGPHGLSAYATQLSGRLPNGADNLTLHGGFGLTGLTSFAVRLLLIAAVMATAFRARKESGLYIPAAIVASLMIAPYLHASDLCLLGAAGWMVWQERTELGWRIALAIGWVLASPFVFVPTNGPPLDRWPLVEVVFLAAVLLTSWGVLTAPADSRRRATA